MVQILGVAFDLEGAVVDVEPAHHGGWLRAADEIGVHLTIEEAIEKVPHFIGGPDPYIVAEIFALAPTNPLCGANAFLASKWTHYDELVETVDLAPRSGFLDVLEQFRSRGLKTSIGTAVDSGRGLALLRRSGLHKLFSLPDIVLPADVKNQKPAPDCFLETARRMGVRPCEQLVFEDSPRGVRSGVAAGSRVIGVPVYDNPVGKARLVEAGAVRIYTDWRCINVAELVNFWS